MKTKEKSTCRLARWLGLLVCISLTASGCDSSSIDTGLVAVEASIFASVDEFDLLAAHSDDPERLSEGVPESSLVPKLAIMACEQSLSVSGSEPRFHFQLGRAYLAYGDSAAAIDSFRQATETGYAAAHALMGEIYQYGRGAPVDAELAAQHYQKAIDGGFQRARVDLASLRFDLSHFVGQSLLESVYDGDSKALRQQSKDKRIRNYMFNFADILRQECVSFLKPQAVPGLFLYRFSNDWTEADEENVSIALQTPVGEHDAATFLRFYGCEGPVSARVFRNLNEFFKDV